MLTYWQEKGRGFGFDVGDGPGAGTFRPADAIDQWLAWAWGNDMEPFEGLTDEQAATVAQLVECCMQVPKYRREFARGYRDALRETRPMRKLARKVAR